MAVFGYRNDISEQDLLDHTLTPLLQEWSLPDKILLSTEGQSSLCIQEWVESLHIPHQLFQSDWVRNGKRAQMIREDRMAKECTHALVFLSKTSTRLETFAERMAKKGKSVLTSSWDQTLSSLCVHDPHVPQDSEPVRKSDTKIGQMWQKYQKKEESKKCARPASQATSSKP